MNYFTVLKDSHELLQKLNEIKCNHLNSNLFLYSCDFGSLYTNIKPDIAIKSICRYLKEKKLIKTKHFDLFGFKHLLNLVFENNVFSYDGLYFLQLIGLPMG